MTTKHTRRDFLASALVAAAPSALAAPRKPNLLYVFSDEHRACSMPGEALNEAHTPNLERFAREGMTFHNCISNYPVCSPYRAMLLTGRWPYQTGIIDNALQLRPDEVSIGETFRRAGYRTGYIGKWHLSPGDEGGAFIPAGPARQGFEDWHVWSNTNQHFDKSFTFDPDTGRKIQPKGYNCTLMTDEGVSFIERHQHEPWMLMISWNPPHPNFLDAPPDEKERYQPSALKFRPNAEKINPKLREQFQGYYGHISAVDAEFGRLLRKLDETGQAANTIVIYTSDHGDMMGSHGYGGKRLPWEESCRVPFLVRYPQVVAPATKTSGIFSTVDIYPTMCGIAGLKAPSHCVGRDLSAAMRGETLKFPESTFLMHIQKDNATGGENNPAPLFRGVRTDRHTYAVAGDGRWLFYDNQEDPYQQHNRIDDASAAKFTRELDGLLLDYLKSAHDPFPLESLRKKKSAL
ncbi:MAG TPA: sulfatase [Bryobacteraceae bacterium]|jgi:arylsulfatase A-like enzyme